MSSNATRNRRNPNRRPVPPLEDFDDGDEHEDYDDDDTYHDDRSRLHEAEVAGVLRAVT